MRTQYLAAAAALLLATPTFAQVEPETDATLEVESYNLWVCEAHPSGQYFFFRSPEFLGYSRLFAAGSGAGQQARIMAKQRAERACEWSTGFQCFARYDDCRVERYQARFDHRP